MKCSYCNKPASHYRRHSGEYLCKDHFIRSIEKKVYKTIKKSLHPEIKIGLDLAGDKNSLVMTYIIKRITKKYPETKLYGILINEGIPKYSEETLETAKKFLEKVRIPYIYESFEKIYNFKLSDIVTKIKNSDDICTYCEILRERAVDIIGYRLDVEIIFKGYNLNNISSILLRKIIDKKIQSLIAENYIMGTLIPRDYPLRYIPENEITLYAEIKKIPYYKDICPYKRNSIRKEIDKTIEKLAKDKEGILFNIISIQEELKKYSKTEKIRKCNICGFPSKEEVCDFCKVMIHINKRNDIIRINNLLHTKK